MATHGKLGEFEPAKEDWKSYTERLSQYYAANDINDKAKQRAILISSCGPTTYRLMKDVLAPDRPTEVDYDEIVQKLTTHYQPPPSEIMQRYRFNTRIRQPHESVATYLAQLKQIAEYCNYKESLHQMLRDRLVCGIAHQQWQKRLLSEEDLTFDKAVKLLSSMEIAEQESKDLGGKPKPPLTLSVNRVQRGKSYGGTRQPPGPPSAPNHFNKRNTSSTRRIVQPQVCYRCGATHAASDCPFKESTCHYCRKKGHIVAACKTRQRKAERRQVGGDTHAVVETEIEEPDKASQEYQLYYIRPEGSPSFTVEISINRAPLTMEVDTGAALTIVSEITYEKMWSDGEAPPLQKSEARLKSYTGESIQVKGAVDVDVEYDSQHRKLPLLVVAGNGPSLLGRNWLRYLQLNWSVLNQVELDKTPNPIEDIS